MEVRICIGNYEVLISDNRKMLYLKNTGGGSQPKRCVHLPEVIERLYTHDFGYFYLFYRVKGQLRKIEVSAIAHNCIKIEKQHYLEGTEIIYEHSGK